VQELIRQLASADTQKRALHALVQHGSAAVEPLCQALADEDSNVRAMAAEALVKIGPAAVEPLCQALKDENRVVRWMATGGLVKIGDARAVEPLCQALKDGEHHVRQRVAWALRQIGDARAVEPLCQALKDGDRDVRRWAAGALVKIGDARTLPRKVLLETRLSPLQRFEALEAWRRVNSKDPTRVLRFPLFDTTAYCQQMLTHKEAALRQAAQAVLEACSLLRGSDPHIMTRPGGLVRPAMPSHSEAVPGEMVRASSEAETGAAPKEKKRSLLAWIRTRLRTK